jgi:hypothetical protein
MQSAKLAQIPSCIFDALYDLSDTVLWIRFLSWTFLDILLVLLTTTDFALDIRRTLHGLCILLACLLAYILRYPSELDFVFSEHSSYNF